MGPVRRAYDWLRDLDARFGYVKRARVAPGDPAPVRLRQIADTSEVVLVNPPASTLPRHPPVARADARVALPPPPEAAEDEPADDPPAPAAPPGDPNRVNRLRSHRPD